MWALLPTRTGVKWIVGVGRRVLVGVGNGDTVDVGSNGVSVDCTVGGTGVSVSVAVIATGATVHHCGPSGVGVGDWPLAVFQLTYRYNKIVIAISRLNCRLRFVLGRIYNIFVLSAWRDTGAAWVPSISAQPV